MAMLIASAAYYWNWNGTQSVSGIPQATIIQLITIYFVHFTRYVYTPHHTVYIYLLDVLAKLKGVT